jgi:hypothetical protein
MDVIIDTHEQLLDLHQDVMGMIEHYHTDQLDFYQLHDVNVNDFFWDIFRQLSYEVGFPYNPIEVWYFHDLMHQIDEEFTHQLLPPPVQKALTPWVCPVKPCEPLRFPNELWNMILDYRKAMMQHRIQWLQSRLRFPVRQRILDPTNHWSSTPVEVHQLINGHMARYWFDDSETITFFNLDPDDEYAVLPNTVVVAHYRDELNIVHYPYGIGNLYQNVVEEGERVRWAH